MTEAARRHSEPFLPQIFKGKIRNRNRLKEPVTEKPQQFLSKQEILRATKSLKQNICVEMLQEGFHRSFSKFFHVLALDQDRRNSCLPSLADCPPPPLEDQQDKMETMKRHLTQAELAELSGSWSAVCEQYLLLGMYFSSAKDLWLRLHFLHVCADRENGRNSRAATEARAQLSEIYLQQGDLEGALHQAECCVHQAADGGWLDSSGFPLKLRAQQSLWAIYNRLADSPLKSANYSKAIGILHQGCTIAKDSGDKQIEGEATYRLGVTYQLSGDHSTAKKYFNVYMKICQELGDASGVSKAYKAIATSLESEGNIEETVRCLQKLTDRSVNSLQCDLVDACVRLGNICYNTREFDQACDYYLKGYEGAVNMRDVAVLQKTQVLLGLAKAHSMIRLHSSEVESASQSSLQRLIDWKDTRKWQEPSEDATNATDNKPSPQQ